MVHVNYNFVVFLSAYLRQLDLSLDRAKMDSLENVRGYYAENTHPERVIDILKQNVDFNYTRRFILFDKFLNKILNNALLLRKDQIEEALRLLTEAKLILQNQKEYTAEVEKFRYSVAEYYYSFLYKKISIKNRRLADKVEHFLQAYHIKTIALQYFTDKLVNKQ